MSGFSNYLKNRIVEQYFRTSAVYLALFETTVSDDAAGTETAYTGYARQQAEFGAFNTASQSFANSSVITFPDNNGSTVTVSHGAVFDAATGGNMLFSFKLTVSKVIQNGDAVRVRIQEGVCHIESVAD